MMYCGKTTTGKVLSENLLFHFEDLDTTIGKAFLNYQLMKSF